MPAMEPFRHRRSLPACGVCAANSSSAQFLALCSRSKWSKHFTKALVGFQGRDVPMAYNPTCAIFSLKPLFFP